MPHGTVSGDPAFPSSGPSSGPAFGSSSGPAPDDASRHAPGPLHGIRVLDLTRVLSGPHAARMLRDMGADVIKVEAPAGDLTRFSNPRVNGLATYFVQQNAGKRNVSIDTTKPGGVALLLELAQHCDVLIENFRPGVMDRMGLGYDAVAAVNPRLIYASITGFGASGPWRNRRAYASVVGAETGFTRAQGDAHPSLAITGYENDPHSHGDLYTSLEMASAILAALYQRTQTGTGQLVEVSMAQTMLYVNEHVHDHLWDGDVPADWIRSFQPGDYPVLVAANGESVVISGHPAERGTFDRFIQAMARPDLATDPRFVGVPERLRHLPELIELIRTWAATIADGAAIEQLLDRHELAVGVLRSVRDVAATDWAAETGAIVEVPDRAGGTVRIPNSPWRFSAASSGAGGEPRYRGEDNAEVLRELLGLDEASIDALVADGVLSSRGPR